MTERNSSIESLPASVATRAVLEPIGTLFGKTFGAFQARWQQFLGVAALSIVPHLLQLLSEGTISDTPGPFVNLVSFVVSLIIYPVLFVIIVEGKFSYVSLNGRVGSYLWIGLLMLCVLASPLFFLVMAGAVSLLSGPLALVVAPLSFMLASAVALIGGTFLFVVSGYSGYLLCAEDRRGTDALAASWFYVEGYWWELFGRFLAISIPIFIISMVAGMSALITFTPMSVFTPAYTLVQYLVFIPISLLYSYEVYKNLRVIKQDAPERAAREAVLKTRLTRLAIVGLISGVLAVFMGIFGAALLLSPYADQLQNIVPESPAAFLQSLVR